MTKATIAGGAFVTVVVLVGLAVGYRTLEERLDSGAEPRAAAAAAAAEPAPSDAAAETKAADPETSRGFLYGRVTTTTGATHEGRLRWGGDQEAFWGDYFNGDKGEPPWVAQVPLELRPKVSDAIELFGMELLRREGLARIDRFFMARFGDIARVEAKGRDVRVTLKSGTVVDLHRLEASDFDDGVRVWERGRVVDLGPRQIRSVELLPTAALDADAGRLHGTVRTRHGEFTGFVQWDREECLGTDELDGDTADGELSLRFDTIRAIARRSPDSSLVTLADGRELVLAGTNDVGHGHRGVYVDDPRYGRVLVSWDAFERLDFGEPGAAGSGPAYDDFPPGRPLSGSVTTRAGRRLAGRLVFDLDESETTETLDAPSEGVDYTIPFGLIAAIAMPGAAGPEAEPARVILHGGEELPLERAGDLGAKNAGLLVFVDGSERPEYLPWSEVERIDLDKPPAMYPSFGGGAA